MILLLLACTPHASRPLDSGGSDPGTDSGLPNDSGLPVDSGDTEDTGDSGKTDCDEIEADDAGFTALFDATVLHSVTLLISSEGESSLAAEPEKYVDAQVLVDDTELGDVGVKWDGDSAQMRWDGKPSWVIGFRKGESSCDTMAGLEHLNLDGLTADPVQGRIVLESEILAALGRPAPRASFARLTVNGDDFGLMALVEPVDAQFLGHHSLPVDGVLWQGKNGADFTTAGLDEWSDVLNNGDVTVLAAATTAVQGSEDSFYADLSASVDTADLAAHWAALAAVGDAGTYPYETDDVYAYGSIGQPLRFIPAAPASGWAAGFDYSYVDSALGVRCVYDAACAAALGAAVSDGADALAAADAPSILQDAFTLTDAAMAADTRRTDRSSTVRNARDALIVSAEGWPALIKAQTP